MKKLNYNQMYIYILQRNKEFDKEGRPAILIKYLGEESLVWSGTTARAENTKERPWKVNLNGIETFFYTKGIKKVKTINLISHWKDKTNDSFYKIDLKQQEELIQKISSFTEVQNPYLTIKDLEVKVLLQEEIINQQKIMIEDLQKQIKDFEEQNNIRSNKYDFKR